MPSYAANAAGAETGLHALLQQAERPDEEDSAVNVSSHISDLDGYEEEEEGDEGAERDPPSSPFRTEDHPAKPQPGSPGRQFGASSGSSSSKEDFLGDLYLFMEKQGQPITKAPSLGFQELDLYRLYMSVTSRGGMDRVTQMQAWKAVYQDLQLPTMSTSASYNTRTNYKKYLYLYELEHFNQTEDEDQDQPSEDQTGAIYKFNIDEYFKIESTIQEGQVYYAKVLKRRMARGQPTYYVQYNGWSISHNEWMPEGVLQKLSPEEEVFPERLPNPPPTRSSKSNYLIADHINAGAGGSGGSGRLRMKSPKAFASSSGAELSAPEMQQQRRPRAPKARPTIREMISMVPDSSWITEGDLPAVQALAEMNAIVRAYSTSSSASTSSWTSSSGDEGGENQLGKTKAKARQLEFTPPRSPASPSSSSAPSPAAVSPFPSSAYRRSRRFPASTPSAPSLADSKGRTSNPTPLMATAADVYAALRTMRHSAITQADIDRERAEGERLHRLPPSTTPADPPPITHLNMVSSLYCPSKSSSSSLGKEADLSSQESLFGTGDGQEAPAGPVHSNSLIGDRPPLSSLVLAKLAQLSSMAAAATAANNTGDAPDTAAAPAGLSSCSIEPGPDNISLLGTLRASIADLEERLARAKTKRELHVQLLEDLIAAKKDDDGLSSSQGEGDRDDMDDDVQEEPSLSTSENPLPPSLSLSHQDKPAEELEQDDDDEGRQKAETEDPQRKRRRRAPLSPQPALPKGPASLALASRRR